ncbi:MAG: flagellar export protein FliJ [Balneolaceae bacterium]
MFTFKLQPVLNIQSYNEKLEKQKLAVLLTEKENFAKELQKRSRRLNEYSGKSSAGNKSNRGKEKMIQEFLLAELRAIMEIEKQIAIVDKKINDQRKNLIEANKEVRILEKLKQKALIDYRKEADRQEQILQNEVATQMFYKQQEEWI